METKRPTLGTNQEDTLLNNNEYFKFIFKKTEKISCAVFYILRHEVENGYENSPINDLKMSARGLLNAALKSLRSTQKDRVDKVNRLRFKLIELESSLRLSHAANVLSAESLAVFLNETDSLLRTIRHYISDDNKLETDTSTRKNKEKMGSIKRSQRLSNLPQRESIARIEPKLPRKERILTALRDNGESSIKDIASVVTDCSEKTIQRDLSLLIKDNLVLREGERRWSKYRLI